MNPDIGGGGAGSGGHYKPNTKALETMKDLDGLGIIDEGINRGKERYETLIDGLNAYDQRVKNYVTISPRVGVDYTTMPLTPKIQRQIARRRKMITDIAMKNKEIAGRNQWDFDFDSYLMNNMLQSGHPSVTKFPSLDRIKAPGPDLGPVPVYVD